MSQYVNFAMKVATTKRRVENAKISKHNKAILYRFLQFMEGEGLSLARIDRNLDLARVFAESLEPAKLDEVTKSDIEKLVGGWNKALNAKYGTPWTAQTKSTYRAVLKKFYRWLLGKNGQSPEQTQWVKTTIKAVDAEIINPNDLFSEADVRKLIDASDNARDKAFIGGLYDSACRPEEYITLRIGDVVVDDQVTKLRIRQGKQGQRYVHLVLFPRLLTAWLNVHPAKNDKNAPLWITQSPNQKNLPYTYHSARLMFKQLCLKAFFPADWKEATAKKPKDKDQPARPGKPKTTMKSERLALSIKKLQGRRWTMYNLRHSRATELVKLGVSISALQRHMGHSSINRTQVYTHLTDTDVRKELERAQGVENEVEVKRESELKPRKCPKCEKINDATAQFCNCGQVLDLKVAQRMEDEKTAYLKEKILAEQKIDRKEIRKIIEEILAKKKGNP